MEVLMKTLNILCRFEAPIFEAKNVSNSFCSFCSSKERLDELCFISE